MKLLVPLLLCSIACLGQRSTGFPPPNAVKLTDGLYIDKIEITNYHWIEFLRAVKRDSGDSFYQKMIPDTSVWKDGNPFARLQRLYIDTKDKSVQPKEIEYAYSRLGLGNYREFELCPVVGITYEQAVAYCLWRTRTTRAASLGRSVTYRLPTEAEWIYAASAGLDTSVYSFGYKKYEVKTTVLDNSEYYWNQIKDTTKLTHHQFSELFRDYKRYGKEPFFNCTKKFLKFFSYGARQLAPAYDRSNRPPKVNKSLSVFRENKLDRSSRYFTQAEANAYGISHMIGNAAEMTLQKGIARGGSFAHALDKCKVSTRYYYFTTTNWLGFRCVAEID